MRRIGQLVVGTVLAGVATVAHAAEPRERASTDSATRSAGRSPSVNSGQLSGVVTDSAGAPIAATLISASGPGGTAVAVCDVDGRFEFRGLNPGTYLLRAHHVGFATSGRHVVDVKPGRSTLRAMSLRRIHAGGDVLQPTLAAGFGVGLEAAGEVGAFREGELRGIGQPDVPGALEPRRLDEAGADSDSSLVPHDHTEKAWRLRRARRSVLKDRMAGVQLARVDEEDTSATPTAAKVSRPSSSVDPLGGLPVSGQFHLLTRATIDSPAELWSTGVLPGQIAYVAVGAPVGQLGWGVRGAVTGSDSGSWVLGGSYMTRPSETHEIELGMSYSKQHYSAGNPDLTLGATDPSDVDQSREAGSFRADGTWAPTSRLTFGYGASLARYGYLEDGRLFSPRGQVTVEPVDRTRVRVTVSRNTLAPGAEEFLPPTSGTWLPPVRTFAALSPAESLQVERTNHLEVAVEREVGATSVVGVRRYYQDVSNQMITIFGARPVAAQSANHYYLTSASGVRVEGWGVSFSHELAGRFHGAVNYSVTRAQWAPWTAAGLSPQTVGVFRTGIERSHDVTTSIETEIPETATQVFVLCRVNTAFSRAEAESLASGLDTRFMVQVKQELPFRPFGDSDWEVLVDVRSLFREPVAGASTYDELLAVSPPKQLVGGLVVHF